MNDFVQMDIFFFITSVAMLVFLLFVTVIGIYIFIIVKKIKTIARELQDLTLYATSEGKKSFTLLFEKINDIVDRSGMAEKIIITTLGTILAKFFKNHGKIKKEAPKKK